jgi:hypothetical protein
LRCNFSRHDRAYAKFLREQERAEREAREYEASEAGQRAAAKKIADDMDEFAGRDPWRDPIDEIVERVSKEDAS